MSSLLQWNNGLGIMITVELHWLTSVKPKSSEVKQMPNIESAIKRVRTSANANAKIHLKQTQCVQQSRNLKKL